MPSSKRSGFKGLRVLITSGPTSVPIDDMRVITNRSTGEMGHLLANALVKRGACVTILEGAVTTSLPLSQKATLRKFYFFDELALLLVKELRRPCDLVIHAAAVSDFSLASSFKGKIPSGNPMNLKLKPTIKLIGMIKRSAPDVRLIGFKFEPDISKRSAIAKARALINNDHCDLSILNENGAHGYRAAILLPDGSITETVPSKNKLVELLLRTL